MYYEAAKHFQHYGVTVGNLGYDWTQMQKQKNDAVSGLTKGIEGLFKKNKVRGRGWHPCVDVCGKNHSSWLVAPQHSKQGVNGVDLSQPTVVTTAAQWLYHLIVMTAPTHPSTPGL
jgi:hypothetical protein